MRWLIDLGLATVALAACSSAQTAAPIESVADHDRLAR